MELLFLLALIILNGFFAMAEIAIVTARTSRLAALSRKGKASATAAIKLADSPVTFMSTVQIGITSIGILSGLIGEELIATPLSLVLQGAGLSVPYSATIATFITVAGLTYVSIVIGELLPKRLGQIYPEAVACIVAKPMQFLAAVTRPFVWVLSATARFLIDRLGLNKVDEPDVTHEDIQAMLHEGSSSGVIEVGEHEIVTNVLRLDKRNISSLMVPRSDIVFLDTALSMEENISRVMTSPHSHFPVCKGSPEELVGFVSAKQLLVELYANRLTDIAHLVRPCSFVPDSLDGMELLEHFQNSSDQMALVVDEFGSLKGLVTLHDLFEALTGEFPANNLHEDAMIVIREDGSFLFDGLVSIYDLKECLGIEHLPEEETNSYQTLSGLMMLLLARVPKTADMVVVENWTLEVVDMDGQRVDRVLATRVESDFAEGNGDE